MAALHITYISGGERSGKSSYGQQIALQKTDSPVYLATAMVQDADFSERVKRHQNDRDARWTTIEEPLNLSECDVAGKVVLLDCITLWLTNIYYANNTNVDKSMAFVKTEWNKLIELSVDLIVISNELGMGVHAATHETRKFVELHGWVNQFIASTANEAWFMVSGMPLKIK